MSPEELLALEKTHFKSSSDYDHSVAMRRKETMPTQGPLAGEGVRFLYEQVYRTLQLSIPHARNLY